MELETHPLDLVTCVTQSVNLLRLKAEEKSIWLVLKIHEGVPKWVLGDVVRLRQILLNLVWGCNFRGVDGGNINFCDAGGQFGKVYG